MTPDMEPDDRPVPDDIYATWCPECGQAEPCECPKDDSDQ